MESLLVFLYSASVSMALFFMLYWILLRKLTDFHVNRFFLLASVLISVLIAAFPVRYEAVVQSPEAFRLRSLAAVPEAPTTTSDISVTGLFSSTVMQILIYGAGVFIFMLRLIIQTAKTLWVIFSSAAKKSDNCYIHEDTDYILPFSFFNHIFINPDFHKQNGLDDILAHEKVHIHERHWIDLLLIELLTVLFWFNPFIWFFEHAIKQNHEFLADEGVLSLGRSPVRYQALLVNQLMGMQVIGLTNRLTFALGPNRLNMMNKQKTHKRKLLRMAWAVPVLALLLTAFARPEYQTLNQSGSQTRASATATMPDANKTATGKIVNESGKPMYGATVIIKGTTTGTVTDEKGNFSFDLPGTEEAEIVISFVGFKSIVGKIAPGEMRNFTMTKMTMGIDTESLSSGQELPPPPPPASPDPIPVPDKAQGKETFFVVEELPHYPGDHRALMEYIRTKQTELKSSSQNKLKGTATVGFTIDEKGKATNIHVVNKTTPEAAEALVSIIEGMSNWSPGKQRGIAVPVDFEMQLEF